MSIIPDSARVFFPLPWFKWTGIFTAGFILLALLTHPALAADPGPGSSQTNTLPLSEVILYSSGVGFFQREGEVDGRAEMELRFKVDDINDLLKSMIVQDLNGGVVSTVTYTSRDPMTKTLKSFSLDLTANPSMGQLLNQARGEPVEILWPAKAAGIILGVETRSQPVGENKEIRLEFINLLTDEGLQSIPLAQVQKVRFLKEQLEAELRQALAVIAAGHDTQKKTVGFLFDGQGRRKVKVAYIAQAPVWKVSYRLVLDPKDKPFLQGWAIIENTTDEDWQNVQLSLVSGRPISFLMDLYQPLYTTRPLVEPELYLSLRPQVYGDDLQLGQELEQMDAAKAGLPFAAAAPAPSSELRLEDKLGKNVMLARRKDELLREKRVAESEINLKAGVGAGAEGMIAGELFQYEVNTPVTLARQKSAMLPIINQSVDGEKVSIYNHTVQAKHPLNGFRLKNKTGLHLMQGPLTIFEEGSYGGDARIEDLAPGQERLLSYSLDLKTEVEPQSGEGRTDLVSVKIRNGTMIVTRQGREEKIYNVRNRDQKKKTVLIEHPFRSDWELMEPSGKPERTRELYRFAVNVDPEKTAKVTVREQKQFDERVQLSNFPHDTIAYYLKASKVSDKVKDALQRAVQLRNTLNQTAQERVRREQRIQEITQEHTRIRDNMARLNANSELYIRYVKKLDLQETELENSRQQIEALKDTEARQQKELNDYLLNLNVE